MYSCLPTHNIVPHTSLHDPPCHTTMKKYEYFGRMEVSLFPHRNSRFKHGSVIGPQYLGLLRIDVECIPSIHDQGKMLVLPNQLLY